MDLRLFCDCLKTGIATRILSYNHIRDRIYNRAAHCNMFLATAIATAFPVVIFETIKHPFVPVSNFVAGYCFNHKSH